MLGVSTSTDTTHTKDSASVQNMASNISFPCNTCNLVFKDSAAQRLHMRDAWHVYNLKRRMSSLPPITAETFHEKIASDLVPGKRESSNTGVCPVVPELSSGEDSSESSSKFTGIVSGQDQNRCCLFCGECSSSLETNMKHMSLKHGLFIPDVVNLSSLESMIGYLRTLITEHNECLYCGVAKHSAQAVRTHMLDKGHCMINLDREPELLEFWDFSDSEEHSASDDDALAVSRVGVTRKDTLQGHSTDEYILPSGRIIKTRSRAREDRLLARRVAQAETAEAASRLIPEAPAQETDLVLSSNSNVLAGKTLKGQQDRTVALRDANGLVGVSNQQIRGLVDLRRKTQRQQAIVRASAAWADELGGRNQKHYKVKMNLRDG